jgi:hypothetical protein
MKPPHVLLGAAALIAAAAGGYMLGLRRGRASLPAAATASVSGVGAEQTAPRLPLPRLVGVPESAEGADADAKERARGLVALAKDDRAQAKARARESLADPTMIRAAATVLLLSGGTPEEVGKEIPVVRAALDRSSCDGETKTAVTGMLLRAANYASPADARKLAAELMASKSAEARRAAAPLLEHLDANAAVPLLLAALDDPDPGVRNAALATLRIFSHHDHGESAEAWRAWWRAANGSH